MSLEWNESFRVGDPEIDRQHQYLFALANKFLLAQDKLALMSCARDLFQYTRDHFAYEEDLMLRAGFPSYEAHVKSHQLLISRLNVLSQQISDDKLDRNEMEGFIQHWALFHIPKADAKLADYLSYGDTKKASLFGELPR